MHPPAVRRIHPPVFAGGSSSVGGVVFSSDVPLILSELVPFFALALALGFANLALFSR